MIIIMIIIFIELWLMSLLDYFCSQSFVFSQSFVYFKWFKDKKLFKNKYVDY